MSRITLTDSTERAGHCDHSCLAVEHALKVGSLEPDVHLQLLKNYATVTLIINRDIQLLTVRHQHLKFELRTKLDGLEVLFSNSHIWDSCWAPCFGFDADISQLYLNPSFYLIRQVN